MEDFDDGVFDHATLSGLWHVTDECREAWSGTYYLGFNLDTTCDYPEGVVSVGEARLWLDLRGTASAFLRFMEVHVVEGHTNYDQTSVDVSRDGVTWTSLMGPSHSQTSAWRRFGVDLSSFAGERDVIVRWRFDTVDHLFNRLPGWLIDDVTVDAVPLCSGNDDKGDACPIEQVPYQNHQFTSGFTMEASELPVCGVGSATAWYEYVHQGLETVVSVHTLGSRYDSAIAVYDGPAMLVCSDDRPGALKGEKGFRDSRLSFAPVRGRTYHIQVGGFQGATGSLHLQVTPGAAPPF